MSEPPAQPAKQKKAKGVVRRRDKVATQYSIEPDRESRQHRQQVPEGKTTTLGIGDGVKTVPYPSFKSYTNAPWTKGDPEMDDRLQLKEEYVRDGEKYGKLIADQRDLDYIRSKKEKEEYVQQLKFALAIPDPERPETQELLKRVAPEVIDLPEKQHRQSVAFQKRLRQILTDGIIMGQDDHLFMYNICRADTYLPVWPIWDPMGDLLMACMKKVDGEADWKDRTFSNWHQIAYLKQPNVTTRAKQRGIFNPLNWGRQLDYKFDLKSGNGYQKMYQLVNIEVKKALLRRLYKGLKHMPDAELSSYIQNKPSVLTGTSTDSEPGYSLLQWAKINQ